MPTSLERRVTPSLLARKRCAAPHDLVRMVWVGCAALGIGCSGGDSPSSEDAATETSAETSASDADEVDGVVDSAEPDAIVEESLGDSALDDSTSEDGDSIAGDTTGDTFVADTFVADTSVPDTFVADTSVPDTFVADTFVADTFIADTFVADTSVPDTGTLSCDTPSTGAGAGKLWYTTLSTANIVVAGASSGIRSCFVEFEPAYPLWTDGLAKRRWIYLPPGTKIETGPNPITGAAPNMDRWIFPVGTRFLKEFARATDGKKLETRIWERTATGYRYGSFRWRADQTDADYTESGGPAALPLDDGTTTHEIPTKNECAKCHDGEPGKGIGFSAVSLSKAPLSASDLTLLRVIARGWLSHPPATLPSPTLGSPVPGTVVEAKGLGYLHANCGHCHNPLGNANAVDMQLRIRYGETDAKSTLMWTTSVAVASKTWTKMGVTLRIDPGASAAGDGVPSRSAVYVRPTLRGSNDAMPPLGTALVDSVGLKDLEAWIKGL